MSRPGTGAPRSISPARTTTSRSPTFAGAAREPRHFGALTGLGVIMQEFNEDKLALEAFRRALAVNPHLQKVPDFVKSLTEKVEGRDI